MKTKKNQAAKCPKCGERDLIAHTTAMTTYVRPVRADGSIGGVEDQWADSDDELSYIECQSCEWITEPYGDTDDAYDFIEKLKTKKR